MTTVSNTWRPNLEDWQNSGVVRMMKALGVASYDEMLNLSTRDPGRYWDVALRECGIAWHTRPTSYLDDSRGREFPKWFPGGRLNWVNTILAWGERADTKSQAAIVAEHENGQVTTVTFQQLAEQVCQFAAGLVRHGVHQGDRVGMLIENGVEASVSLLAIAAMGAIAVPLFSGFGTEAIISRLTASGASWAIVSTGFDRRSRRINTGATLREAWLQLPLLKHVIWKRGAEDTLLDPRDLDWHEIMESSTTQPLRPTIMDPNDPFMVIYTSGTTGKPKGVVHTHGSFPLKIAHDSMVHFDVHPGDVFSWPADMGWIAGTLVLSSALLRGATLVCYDGAPDYPDWSRMSRLIERHGITHYGAAPTLIRGMASNERLALAGNLSTIRILITAGEGIDPEHFAWFQHTFGRDTQPVINYTGGTEVSGALISSVVLRPIAAGGFNTISPGVAVDVVDPAGHPVTDTVGELVIRQPFVGMTHSFWQDDERYLNTYWKTIPGVWVHGDLVLRRHDGAFFMMGRSDDTLKVAGKRLGPAEVEEVVLELPEVAEAAAIGVSDPKKGQRLIVFIVKAPDVQDGEASLAAHVTQHVEARLGKPFRPSAVHEVTELPKTRSSKIMRRILRSAYCGLPPGDLSSLDNPSAVLEIQHLNQTLGTR